jgi:alpha-N-acetylglucosaminidase
MNVCTHSYSLVWYTWEDWQKFIDWMALSGINNFLAMTGQEEVAYKVFSHFGLNDEEIRHWFFGPALLTWSRGQNEYGQDIAGPLPRSFMKNQWELQRKILPRTRSLGMVGQLPGYQGNAPISLKKKLQDKNMTDNHQGTAWLDSLDPVFLEIADVWMKTMIEDFGTDHWYQLDGYFNGGTAPWLDVDITEQAPAAESKGAPPPRDENWYKRGVKAWQGLSRTDPDAIWSFQGWAFNGWHTTQQHSALRGFIEAAPPGRISIIDMFYDGRGEWRDWIFNDVALFGAKFIWTSLHDFGGSDSLRGNLSRVNDIPFAALEAEETTNVWGTGFTPEGIDQNPAYYEFLIEQNWRSARVPDITKHLVQRAQKRYALSQSNADLNKAWTLLAGSSYTLDQWGMDSDGVGKLPGTNYNNYAWKHNSAMPPTPTDKMCSVWSAWGYLLAGASSVDSKLETFRYDLVNLGREVLAVLTIPFSMDFAAAYNAKHIDAARIKSSSDKYLKTLNDLDELLATDTAFQVGGWIEQARNLAGNTTDCIADGFPEITDCPHFYEWNARVQITSWDPTKKGASKPGRETVDYADKHWSGLIRDYYAKRVEVVAQQALSDAKAGRSLNAVAVNKGKAQLAYEWTTSQSKYPTTPVGDAVSVSRKMHQAYKGYFSSCPSSPSPPSLEYV